MIYLWFVIWICINSCFAQQYYDPSDCSSEPRNGSRYECQYSFQNSCTTFLVYRANRYFQTISSISDLFNLYSTEVLQQNSVTSSDEILKPGREVLVPINCFCSDPLFQTNVSYKVLSNTTFSEIACGVFEGLLKSPILSEANPSQGKEPKFGSELQVPLRCACPDNFTRSKRVKFLVTYPFIEGDETDILVEIKYSLFMYSIEDLKKATRGLSEENKIGGEVYKGLINNVEVMIQPTRAKLANIGTSAAVGPVKEMDGKDSVRGWVAPEYLQHGPTSEKVDIFAFGVILLELISAWEDLDGKSFKESITFLGGASEGGCFEQLRSFMDPSLKDDYPLADALCLAVLAKACLEDDPSA
ncbi:lysm domain receptor-like kinase 4 [Quercus suber]|uniref:Lysm domain receptor-like kinase 4 n=1 Tax=Quercus suber TaxID=58331 RepID=A0AAW0KTP2_QUESU